MSEAFCETVGSVMANKSGKGRDHAIQIIHVEIVATKTLLPSAQAWGNLQSILTCQMCSGVSETPRTKSLRNIIAKN